MFYINNREGDITFDYYATDFENQVIVDWETQGKLSFYNLNGKSYAKSFQVDLEYESSDNVLLKSTFKNFDVKKQYKSGFLQNPFKINQRKINIRVYLLIHVHFDSISMYIYKDGFIYYTAKIYI